MKDFVTIEEAIQLTGTSDSTVRRFLRRMSPADRSAHTRKEGKRTLIAKTFLLKSFNVPEDYLNAKEAGLQNDLVNFQRSQLQESTKQLNRLAEHNDSLLQELKKANEDLKTSWSIISGLKDEVLRLSTELKLLQSPGTNKTEERSDRLLQIVVIILTAAAVIIIGVYLLKD